MAGVSSYDGAAPVFLMDADMEFFPGRTLRTGEAVKTYRFRLDREAKVSRSVSGILREDLSYTQFFTLFLEGLAGEETGVAVTAAEPVFEGLRIYVFHRQRHSSGTRS